MSQAKQFKFELSVSQDLIDSAIYEAHCRYWSCDLSWDGTSGFIEEREGSSESEHGPRHALNAESIRRGLGELARLYPQLLGRLLAGELDGPMADVVVQVLSGVVRTDKGHEGEVKYG
jgi:hypothetical protein